MKIALRKTYEKLPHSGDGLYIPPRCRTQSNNLYSDLTISTCDPYPLKGISHEPNRASDQHAQQSLLSILMFTYKNAFKIPQNPNNTVFYLFTYRQRQPPQLLPYLSFSQSLVNLCKLPTSYAHESLQHLLKKLRCAPSDTYSLCFEVSYLCLPDIFNYCEFAQVDCFID